MQTRGLDAGANEGVRSQAKRMGNFSKLKLLGLVVADRKLSQF